MADKTKEANDMRYAPPPWAKTLMWWSVGIIVTITIILTIADYSETKLSFTTWQKRMVVGRPKQEPIVLTSTFKLKPGEYVGPIVVRPDRDQWDFHIHKDKRIHMRLVRKGKIIDERDSGPGLPKRRFPSTLPGDEMYITSIEGIQDVTAELVAK